MCKTKVSKSCVNGDLPGKVAKEFSLELAFPVSVIFNNVIQTGKWPQNWKIETGISLAKISDPKTEDNLRVISLTNWYSKNLEKFVVEWLMIYIEDKIDWKQFGGKKKVSTTHYLIEFISFVLYNWDLNPSYAILTTLLDFEKAFNKLNHNLIITRLADMSVPNWLLKIVIGFLENRKLLLKYKGAFSKMKNMPGGSPAGTLLGMLLFIVMINPINFTEKFVWGQKITQKMSARKPIENLHLKYFDDVSMLEAINLKKCPKKDQTNLQFPLNYHDRTGHVLINDEVKTFEKLQEIKHFAESNQMVISSKKTKIMVFNKSFIYDFMPDINIFNGETLEVVEEFKILGLVISSDMKWQKHTDYICKKGFIQLWLLRRLKKLGANKKILLDIYNKHVRSIMEYASPAWSSMLTTENIDQIERVQKSALLIIYGPNSYQKTLENNNILTLEQRRDKLSKTFAKKCAESPIFTEWFSKRTPIVNTRNTNIFNEVPARCNRWMSSPIPHMTRLLNNN